jgi:hypothetical protein
MSRLVLGSVLVALLAAAIAVSCSKSAGSKESKPANTAGAPEASGAPVAPAQPVAGGARGGAISEAFKLKPDEGQLTIEVPPDAAAGQETIARVIVTPTPKYKINFEYSTNLTLQPPEGVTLAKAELKAGGMAKVQGDAEKFEEKQLAFAVKLTPKSSGSHTINGTFKFAVCDKDRCLAKKEAIAFEVAAK